jgi:hypothetical protein
VIYNTETYFLLAGSLTIQNKQNATRQPGKV